MFQCFMYRQYFRIFAARADHPEVCLCLFLCSCFYDSVFLYQIVGIGSFELVTKLVLCFSLWVFSLIAYFKREERRPQKNIISNNIKYCLSWKGRARLFIFNIISIMFVYFETSWNSDVCCVFSFSQERLFLGEIEEKKG